MNEQERKSLRERLLQYPGATPESVEQDLLAYEEREIQKTALLERGLTNASAEAWLDRSASPRPPGWYSVFFYPGSIRPRNAVFPWLLVLGTITWLVLR